MPLYEYRCKQCGHVFEKIQSFSAPDEKECPRCQGEVERLISAPAIQFKGSGFYLTDYGKGGSGAQNSKGGSSGSSSGDSGNSSSSGDSNSSKSDSGSSSSGSSESSSKPASSPAPSAPSSKKD